MDTIFAEATAPGKAGVAVIRVSGPQAFDLFGKIVQNRPPHRRAALRNIHDLDGNILDSGLVLTFPAGGSFTGEDSVELQLHGSRAIVRAVLNALEGIPEFRPAGPGEFTRRALDNERMDLTQVEGLADLIEAETELQRQQAQRVLSGELSLKVQEWRRHLIEAAALIEATLDFADEEVPVDVMPDVRTHIATVAAALKRELDGFGASERIRDGFEVAILGAPNAGKSTLLNAIAQRQVALTSEIAGTTRDVIELRVDLAGIPVTFLDTAGLRETSDPLEAAGIGLARRRAMEADLRVLILDNDGKLPIQPQDGDIVKLGKADLGAGDISGITGQGIDALITEISDTLRLRSATPSLSIRQRHAEAIRRALDSLRQAERLIDMKTDDEVIAFAINDATAALETLIGRVDIEDLLGDIFSRFCIGK
ncbi:tRNA uridine-5-carboxymethylaminomethyl(34) synthesis GTPase MnmE [Palleronia sp. LCG004]|uniref:tRNA uridine-5-carboxymethylaminomethyl(34) synthesis GTPase MnmE n=1 Tax=Palleronia sp. LCG004 TaxID=3079304 RepID=UPI0029433A8C|nr:tRNA uridine-5-carboxymethylaminomethyl(34) synthesis GTPase MnmE [Palleronia sp. LCG004]WOI55942.1 tRNA uridine-5-carboxymethylaminomethyl(34) synthesis GTPase MnmE [Palleronia sp. LCG004]